jgi:hypothetical protein
MEKVDRVHHTCYNSQEDQVEFGSAVASRTQQAKQDEPLLRLVGMAGADRGSPGHLAARHGEYLIQW